MVFTGQAEEKQVFTQRSRQNEERVKDPGPSRKHKPKVWLMLFDVHEKHHPSRIPDGAKTYTHM